MSTADYNDEDAAYEAKLREMVLVEDAEDGFVVIFNNDILQRFVDPIAACDYAEARAKEWGKNWDMTIQARNAADMS